MDERLQNEKYQELSTLMERLKGANEEQKKHEIRIKYLLNQLKEARIESSKSQEVFSGLMKEFLKKKADIDSNAKGISQSGVELSKNGPASKTKNGSSTQKSIVPVNPKENGANVRNNYGQCKIVLEKCPANVVDPNDIEFKTIPKVENYGVPKYSSPLEYMKCKNKIQNPMEILCPFELDGLCRDKDCVYNHFNKDEN